jgi:hypothetical protein
MEEMRFVRAENQFGTHLSAPPIPGINNAELFSKSCRTVACAPGAIMSFLVDDLPALWESLRATLYSEKKKFSYFQQKG